MKNNKFYSVVLSVLIAFGLWLYVVNNVSVESEETFYNIPVVLERESVLHEENLMITGQSSQTISLTLSGARSDLNKVNAGNIIVKVDVSNIYEVGEGIALKPSISYPGDVPSDAFVEESRSPSYIYFDVDTRRTKEVPVIVQWTGSRSEDYIYDTENAVLDNPMVTIVGPAAVADQIDRALIEIDLSEQTKSLSEDYRYTLCDANGEAVDAQMITTSVETVHVDLKVQRIKDIRLVADVIYGGGANAQNTIVSVNPSVIRLSGSEAILEELGDTYTVASINLAEIEKSQDQNYAITLPEGVTNETGMEEATVSIRFSGMSTREFVVEKIEAINVPKDMKVEIINTSLTVKVRGPAAEIGMLNAGDITATVDFSNAEVGNATYKATFTFAEEFSSVGALKTSSVSATVREVED